MSARAFLALFLLVGSGIQQSCSTEVEVVDSQGKLCLYVDLIAHFKVSYKAAANTTSTAQFYLPEEVDSSGSSCGENASLLKMDFKDGISWSIAFERNGNMYRANRILFTYSLNDKGLFKNSVLNETKLVSINGSIFMVAIGTMYSCHEMVLRMPDVTLTVWEVSLQAFMNGSKSHRVAVCNMDLPDFILGLNSSTSAPSSASSVSAIPLAQSSPLPPPAVGHYYVDVNGTACLMASMGLQIYYKEVVGLNINPSTTEATGICGFNGSDASLVLTFGNGFIAFTFSEHGDEFYLHTVNVTILHADGSLFHVARTDLSLWKTSVGSSYMCHKDVSFEITNALTLCTSHLHIQPFDIKNGSFSPAHDCAADANFFIPITVGTTLAGLVLILMVAYVIGRRKTYMGYQTL